MPSYRTFITQLLRAYHRPEVIDAEPNGIFDRAAQDAVLRWRFRPVVENGEAVEVLAQIRINFNFEN